MISGQIVQDHGALAEDDVSSTAQFLLIHQEDKKQDASVDNHSDDSRLTNSIPCCHYLLVFTCVYTNIQM